MNETYFNLSHINPTWDLINPFIMDAGRDGQKDIFYSHHMMSNIIKNEEIEGDIVECGIADGGYLIWLSKLFEQRTKWGFDSFEGLPSKDYGNFPSTKAPSSEFFYDHTVEGFLAFGYEQVCDNFLKSGIELDDKIKLISGWYNETLYTENLPEKIAILRIDCDTYSSYLEVLNQLYDRVVPGGFVIIDDYCFESIRQFALPLFFKDKPRQTLFYPNGKQSFAIGQVGNVEETNLISSYFRKDMPHWKPDMSIYTKL